MNRRAAVRTLAELTVRFAANVQPGQIVAIDSEPGKEHVAREIAAAAYAAGARFVDLSVFDAYFKRERALHADPGSLSYVPSWMGDRVRALSDVRAAHIVLTGPSAPSAMDGILPALIARDPLPRLPEWRESQNARTVNTAWVPAPNAAWATLLFPHLATDEALDQLWSAIAHVCRLDAADPATEWTRRFAELGRISAQLNARRLDRVHLRGPGTDLTVGLLPSSTWSTAVWSTVDGVTYRVNLPSEEVFTTPDPERVEGTVTATKPLVVSGATIEGLRVRFERGQAVQIDADQNADVLRGLVADDVSARRLGELALVDRGGRVGDLGRVFYDTLLDENAASHLALGAAYRAGLSDAADYDRMNVSAIHVDFMIGSDEIDVTGVTAEGSEWSLLRRGEWQV